MLYDWMRRSRYRDTGDSSISVISDCGVARKSSEKLETHHMTILKTVRKISQTTTRSWRMTIQKRGKEIAPLRLCATKLHTHGHPCGDVMRTAMEIIHRSYELRGG